MSELSEQRPPRKGAKAGYYPDPLGSGRARYWDGSNWTYTVGPTVAEGAAKGKPVPPPTKVCRRCGAQSETFESACPNCGKGYAKVSGPVIAGIVAASVLMVLFIGGCAVFFAAIVEEADEDEAITKEEFDSVAVGETASSVAERFGRPEDRSDVEDRRGRYFCLYYDDADRPFAEGAYFELCFIRGKLFFKRDFS